MFCRVRGRPAPGLDDTPRQTLVCRSRERLRSGAVTGGQGSSSGSNSALQRSRIGRGWPVAFGVHGTSNICHI